MKFFLKYTRFLARRTYIFSQNFTFFLKVHGFLFSKELRFFGKKNVLKNCEIWTGELVKGPFFKYFNDIWPRRPLFLKILLLLASRSLKIVTQFYFLKIHGFCADLKTLTLLARRSLKIVSQFLFSKNPWFLYRSPNIKDFGSEVSIKNVLKNPETWAGELILYQTSHPWSEDALRVCLSICPNANHVEFSESNGECALSCVQRV